MNPSHQKTDPRPRVYWCPGQYGGMGLLVWIFPLPSLSESVSVAVQTYFRLNGTGYKNFKKGLCNIKTKIPKKSTELEGQDRHKGITYLQEHPMTISS